MLSAFLSLLAFSYVPNLNIDYILTYDSIDNYAFSTAYNSEFIIDTHTNLTECRESCSNNTECLGIHEYLDGIYYCNELSNLGSIMLTTGTSKSYTKLVQHLYSYNNSIFGNVFLFRR